MPSDFTLKLVVVLFSLTLNVSAPADDWPHPPKADDCQKYQTEWDGKFRQADADYRDCSNRGYACGDAPARRGLAAVKKAKTAMCYAETERTNLKDTGEFLSRDNDASVSALGKLATEANEIVVRGKNLLSIRDKIKDFDKLSDDQKVNLNRDMALEVNNLRGGQILSKKLTEGSLNDVAEVHKDALALLNDELARMRARQTEINGDQDRQLALIDSARNARNVVTPSAPAGESDLDRRLREARKKVENRDQKIAETKSEMADWQVQANIKQEEHTRQFEAEMRREWEQREDKRRRDHYQRQMDNAVAQCRQENNHCFNQICVLEPRFFAGCSRLCQAQTRVCMAYAFGLSDDEKQRTMDESNNSRSSLINQVDTWRREANRQALENANAAAQSYYSFPSFNYSTRSNYPTRSATTSRPAAPAARPNLAPNRSCGSGPGVCAIR